MRNRFLVTVLVVLIVGLILFFVTDGGFSSARYWPGSYLVEYDEELPIVHRDSFFRYDGGVNIITGFDNNSSEIFDKKIYFYTNPDENKKVDIASFDLVTRKIEVELENIPINRFIVQNGHLITEVDSDRLLRVCNLETKEIYETKAEGKSSFNSRAFTGRKLLYKVLHGENYVWDIQADNHHPVDISIANLTNDCFDDQFIVYESAGKVILYNIESGEEKILDRFTERSNPGIYGDYVFCVNDDKESGSDFNHLYCHSITNDDTFMISDPEMNVSNSYGYSFEKNIIYYLIGNEIEKRPEFEEGLELLGDFGVIMSAELGDGRVVSKKPLSFEYHRIVGLYSCGNWVYTVTNRGGDPVVFGIDLYSISDDYMLRYELSEMTINSLDLILMKNVYGDEDVLVEISNVRNIHSDRTGFSITFRKEYFDETFKKTN